VPGAVVIGNGGVKSLDDAATALAVTGCDLVSVARSWLANPDWIGKQQRGEALAGYRAGMEREELLAG
jgi:2,4-dienoyl-CoA reductase-like NADH-dependent reductase (Old Yellow Enzyme family)